MTQLLLALDFGGTKLTAATLVAGTRVWRRHERCFTPVDGDGATDRRLMYELAAQVLAGDRPAAIGVSFGGPVDFQRGLVRLSHHVPGWEDVPLAAELTAALGAPAAVDNDANVAALGEHRYGAGQGVADLLYVTVSTGVGGGWILGGRPWRGAGGLAGEIGHTVVDPAGPVCLCGKRGCVERLASGPYLAADARAVLAADPEAAPRLRRLVDGDLAALTGRHVAEAAAAGAPLAVRLLERSGHSLGVGLGNAINLVNPALLLLGGGVTKSGDRWWQAVRAAARATALPEFDFDIQPAGLGDDAPLWGAAALAADLLVA